MATTPNPISSKTPGNAVLTAGLHFVEIVGQVGRPAGFAALSNEQRKFLLSALIGSVVPVDGKVRPCEMEKLRDILSSKMQSRGKTLEESLTIARSNLGSASDLALAANHLPELLSIDDRCAMIGLLWDLALCDHELHSTEEDLIYRIADHAGVPRKKVAEQQARAAANVV